MCFAYGGVVVGRALKFVLDLFIARDVPRVLIGELFVVTFCWKGMSSLFAIEP
jgi:hypothetical protein